MNLKDASLFDNTFHILLQQAGKKQPDSTEIKEINPLVRPAAIVVNNNNKKGKEMRHWGEAKVTKETMAKLDFSTDTGNTDQENSNALAEARAAYLPSSFEQLQLEQQGQDETIKDDSSWGAGLQGLLDQMSGNKILTQKDLQQPLHEMQQLLLSKNVAGDIARDIIATVSKNLIGKRLQSFARVKTAVRQALETAITKILTPPQRNVDILRAVVSKRDGSFWAHSKKDPYIICMVGINGVGKSTSLAKIAYYLKQNNCSPILAACDTFRSGAVEQLDVHAKCLDIPLFHKGYAKDPSAVATAAIAHATEQGYDVVLVDTAGRMQNNVPLMKALSKLVVENKPDLVLFVCEALVGNDGMDQLKMFNKALQSGGHSRQIDGIILTKFDTVSDKVGAALTLTHVTGAPVVFCGTGQKYNHLRKLSAASVIQSLFS
jgi:signal recognition particle receptor subunit alpha